MVKDSESRANSQIYLKYWLHFTPSNVVSEAHPILSKGSEKFAKCAVLAKNLLLDGQKVTGKKKRCREVCTRQKNV